MSRWTDGKFLAVFADPNIPAGFAPFGIQNIDGDLFVTYGKQNGENTTMSPGPGMASSTCPTPRGILLRRFASREPLHSPWGIVRAPLAFGRFSGDILVGNFGNGRINAFYSGGDFVTTLRT